LATVTSGALRSDVSLPGDERNKATLAEIISDAKQIFLDTYTSDKTSFFLAGSNTFLTTFFFLL